MAPTPTPTPPSSAHPKQNPQDHTNNSSSSKGSQVTSTPKSHKAATPGHGEKVENPPASAFAEPSEPGAGKPGDSPAEQLTGSQEENPQLVAGREKSKL